MLKAMILLVQILDGSDEEYCEHWADEMPIQKVDVDNVKDTRYVLLLWISLCLYIGGNFCEVYYSILFAWEEEREKVIKKSIIKNFNLVYEQLKCNYSHVYI